jgi:catechol 2,3-dioxygenase-like lactoylglutathione lyase family enzyme
MPILGMDHFTIVTKDVAATELFYREVLDFVPGPRPNFVFPGSWLYNDGKAVLHIVEKPEIPAGNGVLDHMAFSGTGLGSYIARLKARGLLYDLLRVPEGGAGAGIWQLFFLDPNHARVEIDFPASETLAEWPPSIT